MTLYKSILKDRSPQRIKSRYNILKKIENSKKSRKNDVFKKLSETLVDNFKDNTNFNEDNTDNGSLKFNIISNYYVNDNYNVETNITNNII